MLQLHYGRNSFAGAAAMLDESKHSAQICLAIGPDRCVAICALNAWDGCVVWSEKRKKKARVAISSREWNRVQGKHRKQPSKQPKLQTRKQEQMPRLTGFRQPLLNLTKATLPWLQN